MAALPNVRSALCAASLLPGPTDVEDTHDDDDDDDVDDDDNDDDDYVLSFVFPTVNRIYFFKHFFFY